MAEKQAFQVEHKGFVATAYWGEGADARIVVTRDGKPFKEFLYPAYKIFNIAAHWQDIVQEMIDAQQREREDALIRAAIGAGISYQKQHQAWWDYGDLQKPTEPTPASVRESMDAKEH